jgi:succinoglycan biosynthesis protein ExoL
MFHAAGAEVRLLGFCRGPVPRDVEGIVPVPLGQTSDAKMIHRAGAVLRAATRLRQWAPAFAGTDAVMARQLETLVLAALARAIYARRATLVFECLDIHRLMSGNGIASTVLRAIEGRLLRMCQGLVVSSPDFIRAHFARAYFHLPPVTLLENKVLASERGDPSDAARPAGPPWRIGWYGIIRCAASLRLLAALATTHPGEVEVVIRGRVARTAVPDFDAIVAATPGLSFGGPYDRTHDLPALYGGVHFAWAVDFFEAGSNSDWLLPNRLYEAGLFGAVPIAVADVATGAWLARHHAGALLEADAATSLEALFASLCSDQYQSLETAITCIPESAFLNTPQDCHDLVQRIVKRGVMAAANQLGAIANRTL